VSDFTLAAAAASCCYHCAGAGRAGGERGRSAPQKTFESLFMITKEKHAYRMFFFRDHGRELRRLAAWRRFLLVS